jgi:hypothetical protein
VRGVLYLLCYCGDKWRLAEFFCSYILGGDACPLNSDIRLPSSSIGRGNELIFTTGRVACTK